MKKTLALLLAMIMLVAVLAACGESASTSKQPSTDPTTTNPSVENDPDHPNKPIDPGLVTTMDGKELTKLLLAQERLNASILRNSDSIFSNGETVLENLAAVAAANLVYAESAVDTPYLAKEEETVYKPSGGSTLTVSGDTYTWSDFPEYSNSYSYFENLTNNIVSSAELGADMIDEFKKYVRVIGKWIVMENYELLLLVDENSETLVMYSTFGENSSLNLTRRYKNEAGQNVYEIYNEEKTPGFEFYTRFLYIPDLRCEYSHHSLTDNTHYFDHNFYANKEKGFWEVIDVNGRKLETSSFSYMALKDDIFYDVTVDLNDTGATPMLVKIVSPDRRYDLGMIMLGEMISIELGLQSYDSVLNVQAEIPKDMIGIGEGGYDQPSIFFENEGVLAHFSTEHPARVNLTNGKTLNIGDTFVDGAVQIQHVFVDMVYTDTGKAFHNGKIMIAVNGESYDEQMENYKAFLLETGLTPKFSTPDYVVNGTIRALEEVSQFIAWGSWNGTTLRTAPELAKGFITEDNYEKAFYDTYESLKDVEKIDGSDQAALDLNINFSPVTLGTDMTATYQSGSVTVGKISLTASDTLLFVEGGQYVVTLAMLSMAENGEGLIHVAELPTVGTVYTKNNSFTVISENISFTLPSLAFGKYTVVAYIATDDGIRTSQYIPITFTKVASDSHTLENAEIKAEKDASGAIIFNYNERLDMNYSRPISSETLSYVELYEDLASAVLKKGIIPEGAAVERFNSERDAWEALAQGTEAVTVGDYRLAYDATNGEITTSGYVIVTLVYMPVEGGESEGTVTPETPEGEINEDIVTPPVKDRTEETPEG